MVAPPVAPVVAPVVDPPVDVLRCWWCDQPVAWDERSGQMLCTNPKCEAYLVCGLDFTGQEPLCTFETHAGRWQPPERCEDRALVGTERCSRHVEHDPMFEDVDDDWDGSW